MDEKNVKSKKKETKKVSEVYTLTVYHYFDYSILSKEKDGTVKEHYIADAVPKFGALTDKIEDVDEIMSKIKYRISTDTLADIVMLVVYQMSMDKKNYLNVCKMLKDMSEEEIILHIFKQNLYNQDGLVVKSSFPIVFENRLNKFQVFS